MDDRELADLRERVAALSRTGKSAEELLAALPELVAVGLRIEQIDELVRRGEEACWVCGVRRQRGTMEASLVGSELWWLCDRCQQRRANAQAMKVMWPTDFAAWLRRWTAERLAEGRSAEWVAAVAARADDLYATDPTLVNRQLAVLRAAES
jgi:hypothetical protein